MTGTEGAALFWIRVRDAFCIVIQIASKLPKLRLEIMVVVFAVVVLVLVAVVSERVVEMVVVFMVVLDVAIGVEEVKVDEDVGSMLDGAADVPAEVVLCGVVSEAF